MNYLFLGDPHGDLDFVKEAAELAADNDAEVVCVGDWGFIWTYLNMKTFQSSVSNMTKDLSLTLERAGEKFAKPPVVMRFIDGNHDHHPELARLTKLHLQPDGSVPLEHNLIYQPRGSVHEDSDGTRFLFLGGAPSIDRANRTAGETWWPEEFITEEQYQLAGQATNIDVLVTHDAPHYPYGFTPKGDLKFRQQSYQSMEYVRRLIWKHDPELHIHGHWHFAYVDGITRGLDCNYGKFQGAVFLWSP